MAFACNQLVAEAEKEVNLARTAHVQPMTKYSVYPKPVINGPIDEFRAALPHDVLQSPEIAAASEALNFALHAHGEKPVDMIANAADAQYNAAAQGKQGRGFLSGQAPKTHKIRTACPECADGTYLFNHKIKPHTACDKCGFRLHPLLEAQGLGGDHHAAAAG